MTYEEALDYISSVSWQGSRPGLERISAMMETLGNVQDGLKFVHIAGTNGKGSVSAMLSGVLTAAGYRTGLFISPYIMRFNERMQINGQAISDEALAEVVELVKPAADALPDGATEFEIITAAAFLWFAREKCDIVVLETGMGGRLDATNVIRTNECAVITTIGLDHTQYLGDTLGQIAGEKACIMKPGCPVVSYASGEEAMAAIRTHASEQGCPLTVADFSAITSVSDSLQAQRFVYKEFPELTVHLPGAHQLKNAAVVLETVQILREKGWNLPDAALAAGLDAARWPARLEVVQEDGPLAIVDGAHNLQGMQCLCDAVRHYLPGKRIVALVGVLEDKDWQPMMDLLKEVATDFVCVTPDSPRALDAVDLARYLSDRDHWVAVADQVATGAEGAECRARVMNGVMVACGSLYMAADVRRYFGRTE